MGGAEGAEGRGGGGGEEGGRVRAERNEVKWEEQAQMRRSSERRDASLQLHSRQWLISGTVSKVFV